MRSNWTNDEVTYWDVFKEEKIKKIKEIKDLDWDSHNCKFTWETKAVFPHGYGPDYINCTCVDKDEEIIVTGDDDAFLRIHAMWCLKANSAEMSVEWTDYLKSKDPPWKGNKHFIDKYRAHAGYIGRICFDHKGEYLFSLGGNDKALIQWKSTRD